MVTFRLNIGNNKEHIGMPGVKHQIPDPNDAVIKAVAHKIHQKRKQIEKARNEEEAREMEKKRKEDEKRKKLDQQSKSLVAVKDELEQLHTKLNTLKEEKHRLFNELKKVCNKEKEEKEKAEQMNTYLHPNSSYVPYQTQQSGFDSQGKLSIMGSHQSDKRNMYLQNPARSQASRMMPASSPHSNPYLTPQNRNMAAQQK